MDRVAPTRRPEGENAGLQKWRDLLFLHWPVPVEALRPLVPARLGLDLWEGQAWIGVVPFAMFEVAPRWLPHAMAFDFLETNVRTYVHLDGENPGVYFLSLEAASWLAVQAARAGWGLPYHHAAMTMEKNGAEVVYETVRRSAPNPRLMVRYTVGDYVGPSAPDTREHFFLERYLLYSEHHGQLQRGQVHHVPYPAHRAALHEVEDELIGALGLPQPTGAPTYVDFAPGVDVELFALRPV